MDGRSFLKRRVEVELGVLQVEVRPVYDKPRGGLHVHLLRRRHHNRRRYDRRNLNRKGKTYRQQKVQIGERVTPILPTSNVFMKEVLHIRLIADTRILTDTRVLTDTLVKLDARALLDTWVILYCAASIEHGIWVHR